MTYHIISSISTSPRKIDIYNDIQLNRWRELQIPALVMTLANKVKKPRVGKLEEMTPAHAVAGRNTNTAVGDEPSVLLLHNVIGFISPVPVKLVKLRILAVVGFID